MAKKQPVEPEIADPPASMTQAVIAAGGTSMALARGEPQSVAVPPLAVDVSAVLEQWNQYQALTSKLLVRDDYQKIGKGRFKKKSAWRKYSRAFGLSEIVPLDKDGAPDTDRIVKVVERDPNDGFPLVSCSFVIMEAPGGRRGTGYHEVHILEKCCPGRVAKHCRQSQYDSHTCCKADCDGRVHWSHPGDLPATAHTRAKNRAISDLIGAGEISAEEMTEEGTHVPKGRPPRQPASQTLRDRLQLGLATLAKHRRMGTVALLAEFSGFEADGERREAKDLDHLLASSRWAGQTWNKLKLELKRVLGDEYDKVFPESK